MSEAGQWRRCSACKKPIGFSKVHWVCNVSTCNRPRTGLVFCSVECWEVHLPTANHRQSWALERSSPSQAEHAASASAQAPPGKGRRRLVRPASPSTSKKREVEEVLIVATHLKEYVRMRSGYNCSDRVLEPLSEIVRRVCDQAIRNARAEGRRTVLDRDVPED